MVCTPYLFAIADRLIAVSRALQLQCRRKPLRLFEAATPNRKHRLMQSPCKQWGNLTPANEPQRSSPWGTRAPGRDQVGNAASLSAESVVNVSYVVQSIIKGTWKLSLPHTQF